LHVQTPGSVNVIVRTVVVKSSTKLQYFVSNFHNGVWDYRDPRWLPY